MLKNNEYDVVVIGAGASGMMAAGRAGELGKKVLLIERNDVPGKKLLITGKGRCNLTNTGDLNEFVESFGKNGRFLYRAFSEFFNQELIEFFKKYGVETKVERGGRVFPISDDSNDIVRALEKYLKNSGVAVRYNSRLKDVFVKENSVIGIKLHDETVIRAPKAVVATGGLSYPATGSTGDGYELARKLAHTVVEPRASLVPLETTENFIKDIQGLSLKNVEVSLYSNNKKIDSEFGEMLFTHFGISGPTVLKISNKAVVCLDKKEKVEVSINLKPKLDREILDKRLIREFEENSLKSIKNVMKNLLPQSLIPVFIKLLALPEDKKCNQINSNERTKITGLLMDLRLHIKKARPISEAIITKGGIALNEIDPHTMESKIIKGLYFCGEIIDIDGCTGGYNLQAAFSTGYLAGTYVVKL
ncbi:MAG: NAD(P)/FAD-dependent oxidoreductase [Elusimicrobia bacterium]|nr:NAD(P)/FAD-dependent oxidoreductase [Candidatus Liberimonas magnetica]